jgi:hypothetical protein
LEVYNKTAPIYKQGTCTISRVPQYNSPEGVKLTGFNGLFRHGSADGYRIMKIPPSPGLALNYFGTQQWNASDGCYCVIPMNTTDIPMDTFTYGRLPYYYSDVAGTKTIQPANCIQTTFTTDQVVWSPPQCMLANHSTSSIFFHGLSDQTTLNLKVNVYIERAPLTNIASEASLVNLAQEAPARDMLALELYSRALAKLPVGVHVNQNGLGTWFANVANEIGKFLGPILSVAPHPIAKVVGGGIQTLQPMLQTWIDENGKKKQWEKDVKKVQKDKKKIKKDVKNAITWENMHDQNNIRKIASMQRQIATIKSSSAAGNRPRLGNQSGVRRT